MKDIKGYEGLYAVTSCGKVWSYKNKKFLKMDRQFSVNLYKDGHRWHPKISFLVALAYIPNPTYSDIVFHKDGNKAHNWINNLEWKVKSNEI
jgi:hypothetical protein